MNFKNFFLKITIFLFCTFFSYAKSFPLPKFTILTEEWAPYNYLENGEIKGISADLLVLILEKIGSTQGRKDIEIYPWARAYKISLEKPGTILFTTVRTPEREKIFKWVGPIIENEFYFYALKKRKIKINSYNDIKNYKIGTVINDATEELVINKTGIKLSDLERVTSNLVNMKKLLAGRIDLIPQSKSTTSEICKNEGFNIDDFEPVFLLDKKNMYYAFHKDTPDNIITLFQKALDDLKKEGKLNEIIKKYTK